ncbi:MAG: EF-P lysine aminoacylase GenX, partial [Bdellovibrionaceae bacterium]|nr:EF-P lysine aminoacylase GenX [Pseudobdellovibrionaceae bacterium]
MRELPGVDPSKILNLGDVVSVASNGAVTLLAPQNVKLPSRTMRFEYLRLWPEFIYHVRKFFEDQHFLEIATPSLVVCPGTEPSLDYFNTEFIRGSKREKLYLPTSPELHLKKAIALGGERIFEIKTCFRNGEVTDIHQPEFTLIEWYRAYEGLLSIKRDIAALVNYLVRRMPTLKSPVAYDSFTMQKLFQEHCSFDLKPETGRDELKSLAEKLKIDVSSATEIDDYFFLIFMNQIESSLVAERIVFIEKYPPYQAALARITEDGWGDRMEIYWRGLEIANAFHELNDPKIQRQRFAEDLAKKQKAKRELIPIDQEFLQCLDAG